MNLWCFLSALVIFILFIVGAFITYGKVPEILLFPILLISFIALGFGSVSFGLWLIYRNTIKAFSFVEWLFRMKEVYAGWYNNKILVRVQHSNGIGSY